MDIDLKDPKIAGWLVSILVVVIVVPLFLFTSLMPITYASRKAELTELDTRHQKLAQDLEKARLLVRNLARVEQEYEILHKQWEVTHTLLPELNEMPNLLRKVTAAGQQSGVEFMLFRPEQVMNKGFYADNPISVTVQGGYHQTGVFLSRLANLNRIINVSELRMDMLDGQDEQPYTVETEMTLTAYTLGTGPTPGPEEIPGQTLAAARPQPQKPSAGQASSH
ncbi:MAG: type 4a pilus biogenesis protein PilO [bacterium]